MASFDAVVIGTGIIGSFTALHLADAGFKLLVVDRHGLASGTSRASDGNLLISDKSPGVLFDLTVESFRHWDAMIAALGNHCEYDKKGATLATMDPGRRAKLLAHVEEHARHGVRAELLAPGDVRRIEPALHPEVAAVGWWPDERQVQPMLACYQIARHLKSRGVAYRFDDELMAIEPSPQGAMLRFGSAPDVACDRVVLCTGVWTPSLLKPLGIDLPILPRKGQIAVIERSDLPVRTKIADFAYNDLVEEIDPSDTRAQTATIVERTKSGTILCGSSRQFVGLDTSVDAAVLSRIVRDCLRFVPGLAGLRVIRGYAGLRPCTPDGLPVIGPVDAHDRLYVATGHEGTGHGLAGVTGAMVAAMLTGKGHALAKACDPKRLLQ
ncbi:MAG: FAD-binding oxidoreductase [Alphaproteobacteria bacterium]|nr:FAD-binding oxidoreductase [Alphaproteobacteria bacterium]